MSAATMQHGMVPQSPASYHPISGSSYYTEDQEDDARNYYSPQPGDFEERGQYNPPTSYPANSRPQGQNVPPTTNPIYRNNMTAALPHHTRNQSAPSDQYDGAPIPPPRMSSQHQRSPQSNTSTTRHARHHTPEGINYGTSQHTMPNSYPSEVIDQHRSDNSGRSMAQRSPEGNRQTHISKDRSPQGANASSSRKDGSTSKSSAPPAPLVREYSEIINRVIVSDPQEDIERMQARAAQSQPVVMGPEASVQSAHGAGNVGDEYVAPRRQDFSKSASRRKEVRFGEYMLGQTLGEGEFGKVKLGWKIDGSNQVAIKLIRRDSVANNPSRLPKIHREISILKDLSHPNIVRLHEVVETERHIGMILEYASGGELFDYILKQRYLPDEAAKQLFAQLISGVGYLHKKGIVHRDLKLENLMLDKNMNIIITDFGFANTFNPADFLSDEVEAHLGSREFVRKNKLDRLDANNMRRGDLMQTSCGSPCYAAPELVVSDSLYTGRKVDVWSCGVILYAMLCGYLPFDDDPANPEGDNINLLYRYITTTTLTFPEYVSPDARDLLKRILVPDPRKRADLFEVARHSWLSEFHHKVSHITSSTTNLADVLNDNAPTEPLPTSPVSVARSASFSETSRPGRAGSAKVQPATQTFQGVLDQEEDDGFPAYKERNKNRHTLQPEYVEPRTHTSRTQQPTTSGQYQSSDLANTAGQKNSAAVPTTKPLPQSPPRPVVGENRYDPATTQQRAAASTRSPRGEPTYNNPEPNFAGPVSVSAPMLSQVTRPSTQGSMTSANGPVQTRSDLRLPSRGSYGQPVAPALAATNVQGRVTQPAKSGRPYNISGPIPYHAPHQSIGQPTIQQMPPPTQIPQNQKPPHHRRSSTLSGLSERLFGRSPSVSKRTEEQRQKNGRKYPPTSMKDPFVEPQSRLSGESKRSFSWGIGRKRSTDVESQNEKSSRRFSLIPSVSFRGLLGGSRDQLGDTESSIGDEYSQHQISRPVTSNNTLMQQQQQQQPSQPVSSHDGQQDHRPTKVNNFSRPPQAQFRQPQQPSQASAARPSNDVYGGTGVFAPQNQSNRQPYQAGNQLQQTYSDGSGIVPRTSMQAGRPGRNVLVKPNRRFNDAHGQEQGPGHHSGSSGAARRIQDFFRRRGKARADSEYR